MELFYILAFFMNILAENPGFVVLSSWLVVSEAQPDRDSSPSYGRVTARV